MNQTIGLKPELDFGTLMRRSFENLWLIRKEVLGYLAIFAVFAFVVPLISENIGGGGIAGYLIGQYWLFESLLKRRGLVVSPKRHFFAFFGLAIILILPIILGLTLFVLPGLFLLARWIAAPAFVVALGRGSFAAAVDSWHAVRGHTGPIAGAVAIMFVAVSALGTVTSALEGSLSFVDAYRRTKPLDLIELQFLPLLLLGISTATYELLGPRDAMIEDVFG